MKTATDAYLDTEQTAWDNYFDIATALDAAYNYAINSNPSFDGAGYISQVAGGQGNNNHAQITHGITDSVKSGLYSGLYVTGAFFYGAGQGAKNLGIGIGSAAKQTVLYVTDVACVTADAAVTGVGAIAGKDWSLGYEEMSSVGISNKPSNPDFVSTAFWNAGRAGLGAGTLGVSEISTGVYQFSQDGNAEALSQHMGGVVFGNLAVAGYMRFRGVDFNIGPKLNLTEVTATTKPTSFVEQMTPDEAAKYRKYWNDSKLNDYPGVRSFERMQISTDGKTSYRAIQHFDEFGRLKADTHFSDHLLSTGVEHPNPHYHLYELINRGKDGSRLIDPNTGKRYFPGIYGE